MYEPNVQLKHHQIPFQSKQFPLCILADNLELARNIGSLFRIADAFGVEKVYLSGSSNTDSDLKIRKAARSTNKTVEYEYAPSTTDLITNLKMSGHIIISLEVTTQSLDIRLFTKLDVFNIGRSKICLIMGSENEGVSQTLLDLSDHTIHIPMYGQNSSMNVATASAIALYELVNMLKESSKMKPLTK